MGTPLPDTTSRLPANWGWRNVIGLLGIRRRGVSHSETPKRMLERELKAVSHREHLLTGAASVITHQLSLKGKAAAEVAKHLNITHDVRDAENAVVIAECSHIMEFTV